ncbi:hypothetical protein CJI21_05015, partial [Campylobacter coli]|nr:hypothetical protein [Campylobacter coli]
WSRSKFGKDAKFTPFEFTRHTVGDNDILLKFLYAGICYSDIHTRRNEWGEAVYPCASILCAGMTI